MQQLSEITLLLAQGANGNGTVVDLNHSEDTFILCPVTAGGSAGMTLNIEMVSPDGTNWCQIATRALSTVGAQSALQLFPYPGRSIRASVTGWTAGTLTVRGYMARSC